MLKKKTILAFLMCAAILSFASCQSDEISNLSGDSSVSHSFSDEVSTAEDNSDEASDGSETSVETSEISTVEDNSDEASDVSETSVETSESEYSRPVYPEYVEPEYNLEEYSLLGTKGATKIRVRQKDIGGVVFEAELLKDNPEVTDLYFDDGIMIINGGFNFYCPELRHVRLPQSLLALTYNKGGTFAECKNLEEILIPGGVRDIPNDCFANCTSLRHVYLQSGVESISREAFYGCNALAEFYLPINFQYLGKSALPLSDSPDKPGIRVLELPDNMKFWYINCEAIFVNKDSQTYQFILDQQEVSKNTKIIFK